MPTNRRRASIDTRNDEEFPNQNYGEKRQINVRAGTNLRRQSFVEFTGLPPQGSQIISATLDLWLKGSGWSGGPHDVNARRITGPWKETKLTWNKSPAVGGIDATTNVTNGTDKQQISIDVTTMLADVSAGQAFNGIRLGTASTGAIRRFYSSEAADPALRPRLTIEWSTKPKAPVDLSPAGERRVSIDKPTFAWRFRDPDGDEQTEFQVQTSTSSATTGGAFTTPEFQTGWVATSDEEWVSANPIARTASVTTTNLSTTITAATATFDSGDVGAAITGTGIPASTTITAVASATSATISNAATASGTITATITRTYGGIPLDATRYWIVRTKDENGHISPWSDVESFKRESKGAFTIDSPLDAGTVEETTPPIITTLTVRAQEAISYLLEEWNPTDSEWVEKWSKRRHSAPESAGVAHSFAVPAGYIRRTGRDYRLTVRSWDVVDREGTPGDPAYYQDRATFQFVRSAVPAPVTALAVTQEGPGVKLTFNRAAGQPSPDYFALNVDGERVFGRISPANVIDGGDPIVYSLVWYGAEPRETLTYEVEAVVVDAGKLKHSQSNATQAFKSEPTGIWFIDDDDPPHHPSNLPRRMRILGTDTPSLTVGESGATFNPIGRRDPVTIVDAIRGLEGTVTGTIRADDSEGTGFIATAKWMKRPRNVGRRFRLVMGGESMPVEIGSMSLAPISQPGAKLYQVSVDVVQIDEFKDL